jgi:hypothetical protein
MIDLRKKKYFTGTEEAVSELRNVAKKAKIRVNCIDNHVSAVNPIEANVLALLDIKDLKELEM